MSAIPSPERPEEAETPDGIVRGAPLGASCRSGGPVQPGTTPGSWTDALGPNVGCDVIDVYPLQTRKNLD